MPTFGSLFAGIGGIDLGLERAGWTGRWQVEWDGYCQRVLAKHWPDVARYGDITTLDTADLEPVDLIAGGFPCQPFSNAGRRLGKDDARWLWPEFARVVGALRPRYVLVENVPGLLAGHGGMGAVLGDLAALGYDAEWDSIPASAVGAPHLRYRVWIVAHATGIGGGAFGSGIDEPQRTDRTRGSGEQPSDVAYADSFGPRRQAEVGQASIAGACPQGAGPEPDGAGDGAMADASGDHAQGLVPGGPDAGEWGGPFQRPFGPCDASGGGQWLVEPDVGRVAHGVPARVDRLRALGNAVVPQVVQVIGERLIREYS